MLGLSNAASNVVIPPGARGRRAHQLGESLPGQSAVLQKFPCQGAQVQLGAAHAKPVHQFLLIQSAGLVGVNQVEGLQVSLLQLGFQGAAFFLLQLLDNVLGLVYLLVIGGSVSIEHLDQVLGSDGFRQGWAVIYNSLVNHLGQVP